jgi:hypothetical protein
VVRPAAHGGATAGDGGDVDGWSFPKGLEAINIFLFFAGA